MPELPEVETIVRALQQGGREGPAVLGRRLQSANLLWERTLAQPSAGEFISRIPGQVVEGISRRGKFIVIRLSQDFLLAHLRMSGDLRVEPLQDEQAQPLPLLTHDRLVLTFLDGHRLVFNDPRKFGRVWLVADPQPVLGGLGPEPLDPAFNVEQFYTNLHAYHRLLKPLLLDQAFIAGLGNIYTDEALHLAGLHPTRHADELDEIQAQKLLRSIRLVLEEGIRRNGASIDWVYRGGSFQNSFRVYQRTGEPCPVCGTPIERLVIGQRGTHFCPVCQPRSIKEPNK
jgi:formamidopyrimidine-DNA glycosylase